MRSHRTAAFKRLYDDLPGAIQRLADRAFERFRADPQHPGLRLKQVHTTEPIVSARVSRDYRALAVRDGDTYIYLVLDRSARRVRAHAQRAVAH